MAKKSQKRVGRPLEGDEQMTVALTTRYSLDGMADIESEVALDPARPTKGYMVRVLVAEAIAARKLKRARKGP